MKGYKKKLLKIDLSQRSAESQEIPDGWLEEYIGGEGTAVRLLADHLDPEMDKYDAEQPVIFATGPLTGTPVPSSGRWCIVFRSPATGTVGASNCGGKLAPEIKKANHQKYGCSATTGDTFLSSWNSKRRRAARKAW